MNLPEYSLRSAKVIWFFLAVLLAGGALGFATLGKKEDAVFVIKSASLVCSYPGATPQQVEELVTEPIEREVQSMRRVHKITSESYYGLSKIQVESGTDPYRCRMRSRSSGGSGSVQCCPVPCRSDTVQSDPTHRCK